jgi:hypothetical protein
MKNYFKLTFIFLSFIFSTNAQNLKDISGTYKFGNDIEKESVGQILIVPDTSNMFYVWLEVSKAAPSYNTRNIFTKLTVVNNTAEYISNVNNGYHLKFYFSRDKIIVKDESTNNWTWGSTSADRTYHKLNNDVQKFFYLGNGDKIPFSEDSNHFSENYFKKTNQYIWGEALCDYTGTYHAKDLNDVQLQRAFEISDVYSTDRQNVFSSWYNLKSEADIEGKIAYFEKRYASIKKDIKSLEKLPLNNNELWSTYITDNLKVIDDLRPIHKLLLISYYTPNLLIESKYYPLIKDAVTVLNSNDKAIKKHYNELAKNDIEKVSTLNQMRKYIYFQKIHNVLLNTITSRNMLFSKLFISIKEECSDGPY